MRKYDIASKVKCSNIAKRMCCTVREVCAKFTSMPLSLRVCEEEVKARMGLVECVNHNLVEPYHHLRETRLTMQWLL
ncbi:proliferation-associated protein 2G4-like [Halichondria panicea]|uniref:proliferation-associated protein 2G4-like n=1 Tax=Halichondria panicea TaxID=6063 RepID=UPI00312B602E